MLFLLEVFFECSSEATQHSSRPLRRRTASLSTMHEHPVASVTVTPKRGAVLLLRVSWQALWQWNSLAHLLMTFKNVELLISFAAKLSRQLWGFFGSLLWNLVLQPAARSPPSLRLYLLLVLCTRGCSYHFYRSTLHRNSFSEMSVRESSRRTSTASFNYR
jgi:hypothetical protein